MALGLGSILNVKASYDLGVKKRELFLYPIETYHAETNPCGLKGITWRGDFGALSGANWVSSNVAPSITSDTLRLRASADDGYVWISIACIPYNVYTYSITFDPASAGNGTGWIKVGPLQGTSDYSDQNATSQGTTYSKTFTVGDVTNFRISLGVDDSGRIIYWDNLKVNRA
jgi:hypothetical protein